MFEPSPPGAIREGFSLVMRPRLAYRPRMALKWKKLIGSGAILLFLFFYIVAAITIADRLPDNFVVRLVYFAVVGTAWGLPLYPLFVWMNRTPR